MPSFLAVATFPAAEFAAPTTALTFGASASAGAASTISRSDHTHAMPSDPTVAHAAAGDPHPSYAQNAAAETISGAWTFDAALTMNNNRAISTKDTGGTARSLVLLASDTNTYWGYTSSASYFAGTHFNFQNSNAALAGLIVKGAASQSADLQQWQNSAATVLASVGSAGTIGVGQTPDSTVGAWIRGSAFAALLQANGSADLLECRQSDGNTRFRVHNNGALDIGHGAVAGGPLVFAVNSTAAQPVIVARGAASQSANLQEWQNSAGTLMARVRSDGLVGAPYFRNQVDVGPYIETRSTEMRFVASGASGTAFTFINEVAAANLAYFRGAASQTADLTQWQNSAGTVLASVNSAGQLLSTSTAGNGMLRPGQLQLQGGSGANYGDYLWGVGGGSRELALTNQLSSRNALFITGGSDADNPTNTRVGIGTTVPGGTLHIRSHRTSEVALVAQGLASQTADLQQWQDSAGTNLSRLLADGRLGVTAGDMDASLNVKASSATMKAAVVRGFVSQTANLQEWQNSGGTVLASVTSNGVLNPLFGLWAGGWKDGDTNSGPVLLAPLDAPAFDATRQHRSITWGGTASEAQDIGSIGVKGYASNGGYMYVRPRRVHGGATYTRTWFAEADDGVLGYPTVHSEVTLNDDQPRVQYAGGVERGILNIVAAKFQRDGTTALTGDPGPTIWTDGTIRQVLARPGFVGQIVRGAASQTADLTQWQNSAGTALAKVDAAGVGTFAAGSTIGGSNLVTIDTTQTVTGAKTFSADVTLGASGAFRSAGNVQHALGTNTPFSAVLLSLAAPNSGGTPLAIRGAASQTADLTQWQNSAGTVLTRVLADGSLAPGGGANISLRPARAVFWSTDDTWANRSVSLLSNGGGIAIEGTAAGSVVTVVRGAAGQSTDLQQWQKEDGTPYSKVFADGRIGLDPGRVGEWDFGGTLNAWAKSASDRGIVVRGRVSQTADLQQWQNSSGTVIARVSELGSILSHQSGAGGGYAQLEHNGRLYLNPENVAGLAAVALDATLVVGSRGTTVPNVLVRARASQTSDLQQWQDSAGTVVAKIESSGIVAGNNGLVANFGGVSRISNTVLSVNSGAASVVGAIIRGATSQSADLTQWQNSSGGLLAQVSSNGSASFVGINTGSFAPAGRVFMSAVAASDVPLVLRGAASQTGDLTQWQNSAGGVLAFVNKDGNGTFADLTATNRVKASNFYPTDGSTFSFEDAAVSARHVFGTTASQVQLRIRGAVSQTADLQQWQNSAGEVLASVSSAGYLIGTVGVFGGSGAIAGVGTVSRNGFQPNTTSDVVVGVRGMAGQIADLTQWQNSAGTVLAKVKATGAMAIGTDPTGAALAVNNNIVGASTIGVMVVGAASQSADLQQWRNSAGTVLSYVTPNGVFVGQDNPSGVRMIHGYQESSFGAGVLGDNSTQIYVNTGLTDKRGVVIRGVASQTADLQQWQDSAGAVVARVTATGDPQVGTRSLPRGVLGYAAPTASQSGITSEVDLTGLSVTVTVAAGRRIRVSLVTQVQSTAAGDGGQSRIKESTTTLQLFESYLAVANRNATQMQQVVLTPTEGSHTYKASLQRVYGTGTITNEFSANFPSFILVEDIGAA